MRSTMLEHSDFPDQAAIRAGLQRAHRARSQAFRKAAAGLYRAIADGVSLQRHNIVRRRTACAEC